MLAIQGRSQISKAIVHLSDADDKSVPYAASGAAMAVEDGAVLGRLLGHFSRSGCSKSSLPALMQLYQQVRKERAQTTVRTGNSNRVLFHMVDGKDQQARDELLASHDWWDENR